VPQLCSSCIPNPYPSSSPDSTSIYLAPRIDGQSGSGTLSDPYDVSTTEKFDSYFSARYNSHSAAGTDNATFYLAPGNYTTSKGVNMLQGWHLVGSGQYATTLTSVLPAGSTYGNINFAVWQGYATVYSNPVKMQQNIQVSDLTVVGGVLETANMPAGAFKIPTVGESVTVPLAKNQNNLTVGMLVYIQDTAYTNGHRRWWGGMTVTAIGANSVILQNTASGTLGQALGTATPGDVLATAGIFPAKLRAGIVLTGSEIEVQNVTVQDTSVPFYEGPVGIGIVSLSTGKSHGNLIKGSTVKNTFGAYGIYLMAWSATNSYASTKATVTSGSSTVTVDSSSNIMVGNLISGPGLAYGTIIAAINSPTSITVSPSAASSASGVTLYYPTPGAESAYIEEIVENNTVLGDGYYQGIGVAGVSNSTYSGNTITNAGVGFYDDTGYCYGNTISGNTFTPNMIPSRENAWINAGIFMNSSLPNVFANNTISNNTIQLLGNGGIGIGLRGTASYNGVYDNIVMAAPGTKGTGILIRSDSTVLSATGGNVAAGNRVLSGLSNDGDLQAGYEINNTDLDGNPIDLGLNTIAPKSALTSPHRTGLRSTVPESRLLF
jgi:hypothetical protein